MSKNKSFLHVKISGGATAQILGLMNAIYASKKLNLPFKVSYYPYSTGTYWPCVLDRFLKSDEIINLNMRTRGLKLSEEISIGKVIKSHPLFKKSLTIEKAISVLRAFKILKFIKIFQRELVIGADCNKLFSINKFYKSLSGGFARINDDEVNNELHLRFVRAQLESPFSGISRERKIIVHYRLGDKRAGVHSPKEFNLDLIIDPKAISEIVKGLDNYSEENVFVVSDDPNLARELLASAGLKTRINETKGSIFQDLNFMSQADVFIGSNSQVSQLANIFVEYKGGKSILLNFTKHTRFNDFPNTTYLSADVLPKNHSIYKFDFTLSKESHSDYKRL